MVITTEHYPRKSNQTDEERITQPIDSKKASVHASFLFSSFFLENPRYKIEGNQFCPIILINLLLRSRKSNRINIVNKIRKYNKLRLGKLVEPEGLLASVFGLEPLWLATIKGFVNGFPLKLLLTGLLISFLEL